jgi:hypothetical protein
MPVLSTIMSTPLIRFSLFSLKRSRSQILRLLERVPAITIGVIIAFTTSFYAKANLVVRVSQTKIVGQKIIARAEFNNTFHEKIESARASLFLLNEQGKVLCQSTRWVIGGNKDIPGLLPGRTNTFNFVLGVNRNFEGANFTVKVHFDRIILEGGKSADLPKDVTIEQRK